MIVAAAVASLPNKLVPPSFRLDVPQSSSPHRTSPPKNVSDPPPISLRPELQDHAKSILETPALSLGIRNSSGRDAARIAASCGRESLMIIPHVRVQQGRGEERRQGPKVRTNAARRRRREEQRARLRTSSRAMNAKRFPRNSVAPYVPPSCACGYPGVERSSPRGNGTKAGILDKDLCESPNLQRIGDREEGFEPASKGAFDAAVIALRILRQQQQTDHDHTDNGSTHYHQGDSERKSSARVRETTPNFAELGEAHPRPGETRTVAAQTDPERVCASDDPASAATSGEAQQTTGCQTPGALSPVLLVGTTDDARRQRRSTAPGDTLSHARGPRRSTSSSAGPGEFGGGELSDTWQIVCGTTPDTSVPLQREGIGVGLRASGTADESSAGSIASDAFSAELHHQDSEKSSPATTDRPGFLHNGNGDETENAAASGMEHLALQHHDTLGTRVRDTTGSGDHVSSPGALDPLLERRVDEVTRQLQEILREDALQDDGGCNTH